MTDTRIPVTVLTGYLGAGKTTLLNRILTESHGLRIAVIENEYGEVGIDQALVINADEEIFEMNNGCICCTVRGDLIRILGQLMKRRDKFDRIVVETTGLADPGPVAQTFFMDDEMKAQFRLDGVVTLVDAKHLHLQWDRGEEAQKQVAFADVIVLNKCDLVDAAELDALEAKLRGVNAVAKVIRSQQAVVAIPEVLNVGGFDLNRALESNPAFLAPDYPFAWGGLLNLAGGEQLVLGACGGHHHHHHHHAHDHGPNKVVLLPVPQRGEVALDAAAMRAIRVFAETAEHRHGGDAIEASPTAWELHAEHGHFPLRVPAPGTYALFSETAPEDLHISFAKADGSPLRPQIARYFEHSHHHDDAVTSVGIEAEGQVDSSLFSGWLQALLSTQGNDLYRCKGLLNVAGRDRRYAFQGVHMVLDGKETSAWGDEPRVNRLVFIGKNLDRKRLHDGFNACLRA